ncbi:MAG: AraC-like DNA-binding protein [Flammeovirgaceae bacterium]|jgi:AraC-like DNA-binding protein
MDKTQLMESLGKIMVFLLCLFSLFLLTAKTNRKLPNRLFVIFLLLIAFDMTGFFLAKWFSENVLILKLKTASSLLQMPFYYFYVLSVCYSNFRFKPRLFAHFIPFLVFFIHLEFLLLPEEYFVFYTILAELQYVFYIITILFALKKYRNIYFENFTNQDGLQYKWLVQATLVFTSAHLLVLSRSIIFYAFGTEWSSLLNVVISFSALSVTCWFVLKALHQPAIFGSLDSESKMVYESNQAQPIENSDEVVEKIEFIKRQMLECEFFLNSNLTIKDFSEKIDLPEKEISMLINQHLGKHFFDFVNSYRIEKAKELLQNPANTKTTVLEILYEVGFNSKSSFNTAFKKHTDKTPTQFRKDYKPVT